MTEPAAPALPEITTLAGLAHGSPLHLLGAPLIRVSAGGRPDPVTAAIARHITDTGSVFLELPDGRLTVIVHLAGCPGIRKRSVLPARSRASLQHLSEM
jgi:hypothetical protein